ncbi:ABC transporter, substrate-binding protein, family 3 [Bacteroidetes bacterium oral taxon 272 str. F0290]|uniref:transporter substrate-binding domain-containing protein n=1 Tax=Phocaeicola abscessus TaxID=555313 RepID=UPI000385AE4A|nr:transporter substrate-binding domain-containing protein [Phocaeicola abscessus]EPT33598.1 ABC transporter, substrate-binding protein, family 3 [Bacteroidetes bacterium oral taxon 272 str. F0290]
MIVPVKPERRLRKKKLKRNGYLFLSILLSGTLSLLSIKCRESKHEYVPRDYPEILTSGVLHAVTEYNSISFYARTDTVEGFHYELLQAFAKSKGLKVEIVPEMNFDERLKGVLSGRYDLLANSTPTTSELSDTLSFTHPILVSKQILVQRMALEGNDTTFIHNHLELANKIIHVAKGSPVISRIRNLSNEIGENIQVKEIERYGPEQLLALVSNGDIDYAVCDENTAKASLVDFPNLDIGMDISFSQFYSWGVNKRSPILLDSLNSWLDHFLPTRDFRRLKEKYFR